MQYSLSTEKDKQMVTAALQKNSLNDETWSSHRAKSMRQEKELMSQYFADHNFLVRDGQNPATSPRETVASIIINQGTTPTMVVQKCLDWVKKYQKRGPFDITYYTSGHLIPAILRDFRQDNRHLSKATQLFLFPGRVHLDTEAVVGLDAEAYVRHLKRKFTYAFLSAYSFDLHNGDLYFHLPEEIGLQHAIATRYAKSKFLFLDSSKFTSEGEGEFGYNLTEILIQSESVTIYTVASEQDDWIKANFQVLSDKTLDENNSFVGSKKRIKLQIVGTDGKKDFSISKSGFLKKHKGR